ncbi:carbohydrate ABC transporter permease [Paenibacillus oleatilyticus]|uniref:carbohydrate ABC transporter permease n=1 Tax=Paenibacillus oleatilyticus TaxID=2594886 RepID=UPI001C1F31C4|nr:carbohydrate ABC transporter permease [Paenibacillus oleatilyticus]MBU7314496.1 carbohydrate ABC transporter permease [Paenibacillus oleatilyticus]
MKSRTLTFVQYAFGLAVAFCTLAPFAWLVLSSISYQVDLQSVPLRWIPERVTLARYSDIFTNPDNDMAYAFRISMKNSLLVAAFVTLIALIVGGLAAHAFAKYRFTFRQPLIYLFLFTYMIPSIVIVIPLYMIVDQLGLLDSKATLVLLNLSFAIPFVIWIMQSYFKQLSHEFYEAAALDGCTRLQTLRLVVVPMVRPGIVATLIFVFLLSWDDFFFGLLFTSTLDSKTISVAISEFSGKHAVDFGMVATGGVVASIPPLLIAIFLQRFLVHGMTAGGVKE